jgi:transposase
MKALCTPSKQRRVSRWEHEEVLEAVQQRLDENPQAMRDRRETVEHPFGTIKARMGATHFLMKGLKNVRTEMALNVLAYNLTRVMNGMSPSFLLADDDHTESPLRTLSARPETDCKPKIDNRPKNRHCPPRHSP